MSEEWTELDMLALLLGQADIHHDVREIGNGVYNHTFTPAIGKWRMTNLNRDTQFQGFAKALMEELLTYFGDFEDMEQIIARRAYDLVAHTLDHVEAVAFDRLSIGEHVESFIPDLPELPEEQE